MSVPHLTLYRKWVRECPALESCSRSNEYPTVLVPSKTLPLPSQHIDGINLFGLISIASLLYCAPAAVVMERSMWGPAWEAAVAKMGAAQFYQILAVGGVFYHLYNQVWDA